MQFLIYSKHQPSQAPTIIECRPSENKNLPEEIIQKGTVCLTTGLVFESIRQHIKKAGFVDCGEKKEKIDLKRALRFSGKKDRHLPKLLVFNSSCTGAFKRGLATFINKHYMVGDPACLIIIREEIFENLKKEENKQDWGKKETASLNEQDPLFQLISIPNSNPLIKKLEATYIGTSIQVQHARALIYRACQSSSPVLILGESGTGKDVIATQIYENSTSYNKDFFRVNCSALPETLLEGELFGYLKGSYTGAHTNKVGLFTAAENGTIFLDEIGDLSPANQVKILHAVENQGIRQIGSNRTKPVNVRIIAATNRNLDSMMMQGTFREDLYYRISTFRINARPLREHPEDIPLLAVAHWEKKQRTSKLGNDFLEYLKTYHWPGNVRELYSLLNSLADYFGDVSPQPAHVEAIRKSRQDCLAQSVVGEKDGPAQLMNIKSQNVLITIQNILRSVKIELRPFIHEPLENRDNRLSSENLKKFLVSQTKKLDELSLEPAYFKRWELLKKTTRYHYLLDKTIQQWTESNTSLPTVWNDELKQLDEDINQEIMELLWGKIDM